MKFATKTVRHYQLTLSLLLHYFGKLKIRIFCRHSANIEENVNTLHIKCTDFNSSIHMTVAYAECINVFYQNLVLVTEYHVNC